MADEIKTKFGFDITEFKNNISDMNRGIRIAQNEFKAAAGALGDWKESQEGISARIKSLNDIMDLQRAKVEKLNNEYEALKNSGTASESSLKKLQEQISKANAELGKSEGEFKDATKRQDEFGKETEDSADALKKFGDRTEDAGKKTNKFTGFLKSAASTLKSGIVAGAKAVGTSMAAIGTAAIGAGAALFNMTKNAGVVADDLLTMAAKTGLTVEQLQEMQYASRFVDVELETMTGSMARMIRSMSSADSETSKTAKAFDKLGVATKDNNGELRNSQDVWNDTIDALGKVANETERDALAMEIFGRSAQDLNPLIKAGGDELKRLGDEAKKAGLIMSDEMVKKLGKFDDEMQKTEAQMDGLSRQLAVTFLPAIQGAVTGVSGLVTEISDALSDGFQPEDIKKIGESISKKLIDGMKTIVQYVPQLVDLISTLLTEAVNVIVTVLPQLLPPLMEGAMQLIQGLLDAISANVEPLMATVTSLINSFIQFFLENLPLIIQIGLQMIIALANGIAQALPQLVPQIIQTVMTIIDVIVQNLPMFIDAAVQMMLALIQGLIQALPALIAWLPQIVNSIVDVIVKNLPLLIDATIKIILALVDGLIDNLPMLAAAAIQIVVAIAGGLIQAVPELIMAVPKLVAAIVDGFKNTDWSAIGRNIIDGIKNGISNAASSLAESARNAANGALTGVKNFLGIRSPSTVFRDQVGANIGLGVAEGIAATTSDVTGAFGKVTDKLKAQDIEVNGNVKVNASTVAEASSGQALLQIENFYNNGTADIETLAYQFEFARKKAAAALGGV